jgi:hypothetical protein
MNVIASSGGIDDVGVDLACGGGECVKGLFATAMESIEINLGVKRAGTAESHVGRIGGESFHRRATVFLHVAVRVACVKGSIVVEDCFAVSDWNVGIVIGTLTSLPVDTSDIQLVDNVKSLWLLRTPASPDLLLLTSVAIFTLFPSLTPPGGLPALDCS